MTATAQNLDATSSYHAQMAALAQQIVDTRTARTALQAAGDYIRQHRLDLISQINGLQDDAQAEADSLLSQNLSYIDRVLGELPADDSTALDDLTQRKAQLALEQLGSSMDVIAESGDTVTTWLATLYGGVVQSFQWAGGAVVAAAKSAVSIIPWYVWAIVAVVGGALVYALVKT